MELQELLEPKCCLFLQQNNILIKLIFISRSGFFLQNYNTKLQKCCLTKTKKYLNNNTKEKMG